MIKLSKNNLLGLTLRGSSKKKAIIFIKRPSQSDPSIRTTPEVTYGTDETFFFQNKKHLISQSTAARFKDEGFPGMLHDSIDCVKLKVLVKLSVIASGQ